MENEGLTLMTDDRDLKKLPFDQYQRYQCVSQVVDLMGGGEKMRILDVGGRPGLIHEFLPAHDTYVIDEVEDTIDNYIVADGTRLPFADRAFDVVACLDVLEHIEPDDRSSFIAELSRVAGKGIVVTAPFDGEYVIMAEKLLFDYVTRVFGDFPTLGEHLKFGLPHLDESVSGLTGAGFEVKAYPSGNVFNWLIMMFIKHYIMAVLDAKNIQEQVDELYNVNFSPTDFSGPSYRHIVIAVKPDMAGIYDQLDDIFKPEANDEPSLALVKRLQSFSMLINLLDLQVANQFDGLKKQYHEMKKNMSQIEVKAQRLETRLAEKEIELAGAKQRIKLDGQHIKNLELFRDRVSKLLIYRIYQKIKGTEL